MNYDEYLKLIQQRRSCRMFLQDQVDELTMKKIMDAGLWSASAHNAQTAKIIRIRDSVYNTAIRIKTEWIMCHTIGKFDPFYHAPEIVLVCAPANGFAQLDCTLVLGHMMDAAEALGVGACWINSAINESTSANSILQKLFKQLGLEDHIGIGYLAIGYKASTNNAPLVRKPNRILEI